MEKVINRLVLTLLGFRQFCHAYTPVGSVEVFVKPNGILDRTVEGGDAKKNQVINDWTKPRNNSSRAKL